MSEILSVGSLLAYAYAGIAFAGGLFPDCVIAAIIGVGLTAAALLAHHVAQCRVEATLGRPTHCDPARTS